MVNKLKIAIFTGTAVLLPVLSFAHEYEGIPAEAQILRTQEVRKTEVREKVQEVRTQAQDTRKDLKEVRTNISEKRDVLKTEVMEKRDSLKTNIMQKREALKVETRNLPKEQVMERREVVRTEIKEQRTDLRDIIKEKREAFKDEAKERINVLKDKVTEERAKKIEAFFGSMIRKFEAAISRLRILADRIDSRLDKFEDEGKDVSSLRTALDNARNTIESAEDALDKAKEEFTTFASTENPKEYFAKVKEVIHNVAVKVRESHKALVDVINLIKGVSITQ